MGNSHQITINVASQKEGREMMVDKLGLSLAGKIVLSKELSFARQILTKFLNSMLDAVEWEMQPKLQQAGGLSDLINEIRKEVEITLSDSEAVRIYFLASICAIKTAEMAEVGVYQGGSARLICEAKGDRALHLFDTFEGHPEVNNIDRPFYEKGQLKASLENVQRHLAKYKNVHFYKGLFPATAEPLKNKRFSFVHLDVDLYESTLNCLHFFYPGMEKGGVIMSHDYPGRPGVKRAFDEVFKDKPESIIRISANQSLVVKV